MSQPSRTPHKSGNGKLNRGPHLDRLEQLEAAVGLIQQSLAVQFTRMAEMQAELDRLKGEDMTIRKERRTV